MRTAPAVTLTAAALLLLLTPAAAHAADDAPSIAAHDITVTVVPGTELTLPLADFVTGTEHPGLADENFAVVSGTCDASFTYSGGRAGIDIALAADATEACKIAVVPHDAANRSSTMLLSPAPALITVLAAPAPTPTPTPEPVPDSTPTATGSPSSAPRHGVPSWQQVLALSTAFGALGVGSTIALRQHCRRTIHERSDQP